jgi:hypothetical protein
MPTESRSWLQIPRVNTFEVKTCEHSTDAVDLTTQILDVHSFGLLPVCALFLNIGVLAFEHFALRYEHSIGRWCYYMISIVDISTISNHPHHERIANIRIEKPLIVYSSTLLYDMSIASGVGSF